MIRRSLSAAVVAALALALVRIPAATAAAAPQLSSQQREELNFAYEHLVNDFYQKVDRQLALDGARQGIIAYLHGDHVAKPQLPELRATGDDDAGNTEALDREVEHAVHSYGAAMKPIDSIAPPAQITFAAISGMLHSVKDKYTTFLTPRQYAELNDNLDGTSFGGVGISYSVDADAKALTVENVILDGPSDKAGVQPEDRVVDIDGKPVADLLAPAASESDADKRLAAEQKIVTKALRGKPGTQVRLTLDRAGETLAPVTIVRAEIRQPSVLAKMLPGAIGYIDLSVFGQTTGDELNTALKRLDAEGAKAYILDLRSNGGGYLNAAVDVSSKFISSGPIVSVQSRGGGTTEYDAEDDAISPRPLAVLVNQYTASASEITAGAIQDSDVGTIIGTKTYGKGVVQSIWALPDGSAIKITTARYFTPKGRDINAIGIEPQIKSDIPQNASARRTLRFGDPAHDPQLDVALNFINGKLAQQNATASPPAATAQTQTR